jgi:mannose-6-phosphate isomerase-like protein (cupin superfamily)
MAEARPLGRFPVHLGPGARALPLPEFTGAMDWYEAYAAAHAADGADGRLVSLHSFAASWDVWEMHPHGDELVVCTEGAITLVQEMVDGSHLSLVLGQGDYAINPAGVWHTADVARQCSALFITSGWGTEHRPRG